MSRAQGPLLNRLLDTVSLALTVMLGKLPLSVVSSLGAVLGRGIGVLVLRRRRFVVNNLRSAGVEFPEREYWRSWSSAGRSLFEIVWSTGQQPQTLLSQVEVENLDTVREAAAEGRGILLVSAHFGNWELIPSVLGCAGLPVAVVARRLRTPRVEQGSIEFRARCGVRTLMRGEPGASVAAYRFMARGGVLGCMMDRTSKVRRILVPFLGFGMYVPLGPAELAMRSGSPVILGMARRGKRGRARVSFDRIEWSDLSSPEELAMRVASSLEQAIRPRPAEWYWILRRQHTWEGTSVIVREGELRDQASATGR